MKTTMEALTLLRLTEARSAARGSDPQRVAIPNSCKLFLTIVLTALIVTALGGETTKEPASITQPTVIYVADFEIDATKIKIDPAAPPAPPKAPGLLGKVLPTPPGAKRDPQSLARELVDSMSVAVIKDLTKAGLTARRLPSGEPFPTAGWLVRGVFTNVNQGNQLERAVVGLGKGKTDLQVLVDIAHLAQGAPTNQLNEVKATASSGKTPGSAPMIERHPAAVAARFVIAGNDLNHNVKQTAAKIAEEVVERTGFTQ